MYIWPAYWVYCMCHRTWTLTAFRRSDRVLPRCDNVLKMVPRQRLRFWGYDSIHNIYHTHRCVYSILTKFKTSFPHIYDSPLNPLMEPTMLYSIEDESSDGGISSGLCQATNKRKKQRPRWRACDICRRKKRTSTKFGTDLVGSAVFSPMSVNNL